MTAPTPPPLSTRLTVRPAFAAGPEPDKRTRATAVGEADQVARILLAGYANAPEASWLVADRDRRLPVYGVLWPAMVRYGLAHGLVDVAVDQPTGVVLGAAVWFPLGAAGDPDAYRQALTDACGELVGRFLRYDQLSAAHQPNVEGGWRLAWLAVAPGQHRRGVASAILRHRHTVLDLEHAPAVLTATSPRARTLFTRHHYTRTTRVVHLPGGPTIWPMLRTPQPAAATEPGDVAPGKPLPHRTSPPAIDPGS